MLGLSNYVFVMEFTHDPRRVDVLTVVVSPFPVRTLRYGVFISGTSYVIQPEILCSFTKVFGPLKKASCMLVVSLCQAFIHWSGMQGHEVREGKKPGEVLVKYLGIGEPLRV